MRESHPILVDVDGVCADFNKGLLDYINRTQGTNLTEDQITVYSTQEAFKQHWTPDVEDHVRSEGFCYNLDVIPGSIHAINELRARGYKILFVTAPYTRSKTWSYDRIEWLKKYFNASHKDIIFAHDKKFVYGMTLIDDKVQNVVDWSMKWRDTSILYSQPWNKAESKLLYNSNNTSKDNLIHTVNNWTEVLKEINSWYGKRNYCYKHEEPV